MKYRDNKNGWFTTPRGYDLNRDGVRDFLYILIFAFIFGCIAASVYLFVTS